MRAALLCLCLALTSCGTIRRNIESVDFKASYGGASTRTHVVLRDYSK